MGGDPEDLPEQYAERSPVTYVEHVAAPVLLVAGEHDSACPIRQVRHYAERLRASGGDVTLDVYDAGHHATAVDEQLRQARRRLDFYARHLGR
jgi:dipeptidyl aminopeptidase/acylaminoacyl peptidase